MGDEYHISGEEVVQREVSAVGNGAHVYVPKEWLGSEVKVVRLGDASQPSDSKEGKDGCTR